MHTGNEKRYAAEGEMAGSCTVGVAAMWYEPSPSGYRAPVVSFCVSIIFLAFCFTTNLKKAVSVTHEMRPILVNLL